jgi:3D (Asp-Asp-Asp) domain-containing protein
MRVEYALCPVCQAVVVEPTAYTARVDGGAQVHARITGHTVEVYSDDDPDEYVRTVAGEPALFPVGPGPVEP